MFLEIKYNMKVNNYNEQLKKSMSIQDKLFWQSFFENKIDWQVTLQQEYAGIDGYINNTKVQFKLRETYYNDILIEFAHTNGEKGWINKQDQECEYIFFGWRNYDFIYCFKWLLLQEFWQKNQVNLINMYGIKNAINKNKITLNTPVPFKELNKIANIKNKII